MKNFIKIEGLETRQNNGTKDSKVHIMVPYSSSKTSADEIEDLIIAVIQKHIKSKGDFRFACTAPIDYYCRVNGYLHNLAVVSIEVNRKRRYDLADELRGKRLQSKFKRNLYARHLQDAVYYFEEDDIKDYYDLDKYQEPYQYSIVEKF